MKFLMVPSWKDVLTSADLLLIEESLQEAENETAQNIGSIINSNEPVTKKEKDLLYDYTHGHMTELFDVWYSMAEKKLMNEETYHKAKNRTAIWREMGKWRALSEKIKAIMV